jgi:hypothetical protein
LDNVILDRNAEGVKYPEPIRDQTLKEIISDDHWIIEGVQFKDWTMASIDRADYIFILNPNVYIRDYRIVKRFIKSRTGIEPWNYKQSVSNLMKMIVKWNHGYRLEELLGITEPYQQRRYIVKNRHEVVTILQTGFSSKKGEQ